jgi:hypothetical protein
MEMTEGEVFSANVTFMEKDADSEQRRGQSVSAWKRNTIYCSSGKKGKPCWRVPIVNKKSDSLVTRRSTSSERKRQEEW